MNTTFSIDFQPSGTYRFYCLTDAGEQEYGPFPDEATAEQAIREHVSGCRDCFECGSPLPVEIPDVESEVTLPGDTARAALVLLGLRPAHDFGDGSGVIEPEDLLGRTLVAIAFPEDIRMPQSKPTLGNLYTMSKQRTKADEFLEQSILALADLASAALALNRAIEWW